MFHESNEITKRVFEMDDIYIWGFLVISLGGLAILVGQGIFRFFKKRLNPEPRGSNSPRPPAPPS